MSEKKNIERLFQEKFKDFEVTPDPMVWESIASKLEKKEDKKRIFPFWFNAKAAGIAAALVLGFFVVNLNEGKLPWAEKNAKESVVSIEKDQHTETLGTNSVATSSNVAKENEKSAIEKNNSVGFSTESIASSETTENHSSSSTKTPESSNQSSQKDQRINPIITQKQTTQQQRFKNATQAIALDETKTNQKAKRQSNQKFHTSERISNEIKSSVASVNTTNKVLNRKHRTTNKSYKTPTSVFETQEVQESSVANLEHKKQKYSAKNKRKKTSSVVNPNSFEDSTNPFLENRVEETQPKDALVEMSQNKIKESNPVSQNNQIQIQNKLPNQGKDSVVVATVENPLDKIAQEKVLEKQKEKEVIASAAKKHWEIQPNIAPVFMSASQGSPIASEFSDNRKNYDTNLSVGLGVNYAISKKFTIRTGVHKFDVDYNTADIGYYASLNAKGAVKTLGSIVMDEDKRNMVIADLSGKSNTTSPELASQNMESGLLNQKFGFIEIPAEVSYKLIDQKIEVNLITGMSTLFLNTNQVSVISDGKITTIGEVNNLNKVHFSSNLGVGFSYHFWKSFKLNLEPTFKYQWNTFSQNAGDFKPYIIGLYTGVSFKF